jgi:hypothetical protein
MLLNSISVYPVLNDKIVFAVVGFTCSDGEEETEAACGTAFTLFVLMCVCTSLRDIYAKKCTSTHLLSNEPCGPVARTADAASPYVSSK